MSSLTQLVPHVLTVCADAEGTGVYLTCSCGWRHAGWDSPPLTNVVNAASAHLAVSSPAAEVDMACIVCATHGHRAGTPHVYSTHTIFGG